MVGVMGVGGGQVCAQLNRVRALPEVQRGVKLKAAGGKRGKREIKEKASLQMKELNIRHPCG